MATRVAQARRPSASEALNTPKRLKALMGDRRAMFLPITHTEKNQALTILDYLKNPNHPGGVHDHLAEIFDHNRNEAQKRGQSRAYGLRQGEIAVQSVLFEYADHHNGHNAAAQKLGVLASRIKKFRDPAATLGDVAERYEGDTTGMPEFVRTLDIAAVKDGRSRLRFDPLLTREVRLTDSVRGKNKIVQSNYVEPLDALHRDHIEKTIENYAVGDALSMVPRTITNAEHGMQFWGKVFQSHFLEYQIKADNAAAMTDIR